MSGPNDPALREREKKDAGTISMGMKMTEASTQCWKAQVHKEFRIREEWKELYDPQGMSREDEIVQRVRAREAEEKAKPADPNRSLLYDGVSKDGKGRAAYLKARLNTPLQAKNGQPLTASQMVGWTAHEIPPPKADGLPSYGRKPVIKNGFFRRTLGSGLGGN